jgi:O-antigen/teichoic acid export membrane protein
VYWYQKTPPLENWSTQTLVDGQMQESKTLHARILSGSFVLLLGSGLTAGINFAYNVAVARFLGPTAFGHATVAYTLLTLMSAVTLSFQIVPAKVVAQQSTPEAKSAAYRDFHRGAWGCGLLIAFILVLFQAQVADFLKLPSPVLVVLIALGAAFYVPLGSRRGFIQGAYGFRSLSASLVLEGLVRLFGSLLMIMLGAGVNGVVAANAAAMAVAYFAAAPKLAPPVPSHIHFRYALRESVQALVFFAGQVLINNCDIVLVKHFFSPALAGLYAAVAMVGRVIFAFSQAVVNSMFPLVAGTGDEERRDLKVIATSLLLVLSIGCSVALALRFAPASIWTSFFGPGFAVAGIYGMPYLLSLYAVTTTLYCLSVVVITYEMSYKIANTSWIQLGFSGVLVAGISVFHSSLRQVILVQLVLMGSLLILVALPFLFNALVAAERMPRISGGRPIRLIQPVTEDEAIAEFLKSEFYRPVFRDYQEMMQEIVTNPNLEDPVENAKRRALFFIRHFALWKELPVDTEWYEVEIGEADLEKIRVFPRAQWRNFAPRTFSIIEVAERMRKSQGTDTSPFQSKIETIGSRLLQTDDDLGTVLLIGVNENEPLTILDGNHRLVASMLTSPHRTQRLRFLCGFSPKMTECCWYETNLATLFRYGKNVLKHLVRDHEAELDRLLQRAG